tara:strand:+ start:209 stop:415 length:207 start_codon:yes stop_codon:yes gene_type:complete
MKNRGGKSDSRVVREATIIILAGLVGVFLSKFIDIVWQSTNVWNPLVLIIAIVVTFFMAFGAMKLLPF